MDVELPIEFTELRDATRKQLESIAPLRDTRRAAEEGVTLDRERWEHAAESGWTGLLVPESHDGGYADGDGVYALGVILQEAGRALIPDPIVTVNAFGWALANHGSPEQQAQYLPSVCAGDAVGVFVPTVDATGGGAALEAEETPPGYTISGVAAPVPDIGVADVALVTARTPAGASQFLVPLDAPGVSRSVLKSLDLTKQFGELRLDEVQVPGDALVGARDGAATACQEQTDVATALHCAELLGAVEALFEMTLHYAKERKAFGRSIGSFQVIKHRLVDMLSWVEESKAATLGALRAIVNGAAEGEHASIAKLHLSERGPAIARMAHQIHGGIGFTWESDVHLYMRRIESGALLYGDATHHLDRLAAMLHGGTVQAPPLRRSRDVA